jgi:hypothetical protein
MFEKPKIFDFFKILIMFRIKRAIELLLAIERLGVVIEKKMYSSLREFHLSGYFFFVNFYAEFT